MDLTHLYDCAGCDDLTSEAKPAVIWDSPVSSELNVRRAQGPGASQVAPNTSQGQRITNTAQLDGTTQLRLGRFAETAGAGAGVEVGPGHHAASLTAEQGSDGPGMGEKSSRCGQCGKTFTTRFYLKIHQRIHTGERPYTCLQCGKRFYCNSHLISHQRCHTGEKPYSCEECGKSYSHLNSLKLHQRSHTEEEAYDSKSAGALAQLLPDARDHGSARFKIYPCRECGKRFTQRNRLVSHQWVHTGSKPFRCEECGKGFTQRTRLITHKRIHTGEKPYHCQLCGKMFSRQDNCLRHVRLHSGQRW
uniref:C2H2-type domain-containing protein n=1 Tax=Electrophorus electricus TaxID=8005 RepID=A0A4W4GBK8_ELEEL